jgi:hypothetical protein
LRIAGRADIAIVLHGGFIRFPGLGDDMTVDQADWKTFVVAIDHANEARIVLAGVSAQDTVRTVEFRGSGHVGHVVMDGEKYRDAIFPRLAFTYP